MCMKALSLVWWNVRLKKALPASPDSDHVDIGGEGTPD